MSNISIKGYAAAQSIENAKSATIIDVALDWTPNTIHSGLFLAQSQGLYEQSGLDVRLHLPDPEYTKSPAKRLKTGKVHLAICPSESIIAYAETERPNFRLEAIYAILQRDASAIVARKDKFTTLKELESGVYGSYNARYEDRIVRSMVTEAGGNGLNLQIESAKEKLSLFDELKKGSIDATWIFMPWEGVQADAEKFELSVFRTEDVGIPYGYSPVIARNTEGGLPDEVLRKFVHATRLGYQMAIEQPERAAQVLEGKCQLEQTPHFLETSQKQINDFYSDGSELGTMQEQRWKNWVKWLSENMLVSGSLEVEELFTNKFHQ